jgi:hypothetical protein
MQDKGLVGEGFQAPLYLIFRCAFRVFMLNCPFSDPRTCLMIENSLSTSADVPGMENAYWTSSEKHGMRPRAICFQSWFFLPSCTIVINKVL